MPNSHRTIGRAITCLLFASCIAFPAASQNAIDDLGDLQVLDMSSDGSLVLGYRNSAPTHLILWSPPSDETIIPFTAGGRRLAEGGSGISSDGSIVVGSDVPTDFEFDTGCDPDDPDYTPGGRIFPFMWTGGITTRLNPPDQLCYAATAVSNTGRIVGARLQPTDSGFEAQAVSYNGSFTDMHPAGYDASAPVAISDDGNVVVGWARAGGTSSIVMWTASGMQTLFEGENPTLSDDGTVVVGIDRTQTPNAIVRWTAAGGRQTITQSHGGFAAVSGDGETVAFPRLGAFGPHNGWHTRIWTVAAGDESLWQILTDRGVDPGAWGLPYVRRISYDGRIVAGYDYTVDTGFRVDLSSCSDQGIAWTASSGGDYEEGSNWDGGSVPPDTSVIAFDNAGANYAVAFMNDRVDSDATITGDVVTFNLGQTDYTLTGTCSGTSLEVNSGGSLTLSDGDVLANGSVRVAEGLGPELIVTAQASLSVDADYDDSGNLVAGTDTGNSLVQVDAGSSLDSPNRTILGSAMGESGELSVEGAFTGGEVEVGRAGEGELYVGMNAVVTADKVVAGGQGGSGVITVDGGELFADELMLSDSDVSVPSSLTASNLADLNIDVLKIGRATGANGDARITRSNLTADVVVVGESGFGDLVIDGGSTVNTLSVQARYTLGVLAGSLGRMTVDGAATELQGRSLLVGDAGEGDFRITGGASVAVNRLYVALSGPGYFEIDGSSTLTVNTADWGQGATIVMNGIFLVGQPPVPKSSNADDYVVRTDTLIIRGQPSITADSVSFGPGGVIISSGVIPFEIANSGVLNPGEATEMPGTMTLGSDYEQTAEGTLEIELGGTGEGEYDRLVVGGTATLAGNLSLRTLEGYEPNVGDTFEILQAGQVEGAFGQIDTDGDYVVDVSYGAASVTVSIVSFVATESAYETPTEFLLDQNYPNPFNPSTRIRFQLPIASKVRLVVFDALGREVAVLMNGRLPAGTHEYSFDAHELSSGAYIYQLGTSDLVLSRSMLLLK